MAVSEEIVNSKHISLSTYRKDGTVVATPVWQVPHEGKMIVVTEAKSFKVKRIRNDSRVLVTPCSVRGKVEPGAPSAEGTAQLLDEQGTAEARALLARRYLTSRLGNAFAGLLRIKRPPMIGIEITLNGR